MGNPSPNPIDRHVGARLAALRQDAGLSQGQLAERLGLAVCHIDDYERGAIRITGPELYRLCQVLECPVSVLFDGWDEGIGNGARRQAASPLPDPDGRRALI